MKTGFVTKFKETEIGTIPEEWGVSNVGKIGKVVTGKTPPTSNINFYGDDYPFVKIPDMNDSVFITKTGSGISEEGAKYLGNAKLPENSVMVSCIATIGNVGITSKESFSNQQINTLIPNKNIADYKYLYYFFKNNKELLESLGGGGSVYTNISKSKFESMVVVVPGLSEQKQIAEILSSLDDKIELNRQINVNFEKVASSLFKQWFVDFESPDENGKPYKSSGGKMIDSKLDKIPEWWKIEKVGNLKLIITDYVANGSFASLKENVSKIYEHEEYALFLRNTDLKNNFASKRYVDKKAYDFLLKTHLKGGEVIISNVADVGSVYKCPTFKMPMVLGNNVIMLDGKLLNNYLYLFFTSQVGQAAINSITSGSAQLKFNKTDFRNLEIVKPDDETLKRFDEICEVIFKTIQNNEDEINRLISARDSLLPRLMSGKIKV